MDGNFIFNMQTTNGSKIEKIRNNRQYKLTTPNKQYIIKYQRNPLIHDPYDADDEKGFLKNNNDHSLTSIKNDQSSTFVGNLAKRLTNSPKNLR